MASKKKAATTVVAVATAAALLLGGTFAWQSISQTAINEASDVINPGGRLHNDMWYVSPEENNNDVYVENFDKEDIFARVRLEEYFEIVLNYGTNGEKSVPIIGMKTETDGKTTYTYERFTDYESHATELQAGKEVGVDGSENAYWTWQMGGETVYMPTFNMNKDSLLPDLNGIYEGGNVGTISNRVPVDVEGHQYSDWKDWANELDPTKTANEIWDIDSNDVDELKALSFLELDKLIDGADDAPAYDENAVTLVNKTHEAKSTQSAQLVSMTEWMSWFDDGNGGYDANLYDPDVYGNYWVYDNTEGGAGWVYWSAKLAGGEATGLLLNGTTLNQVMDDTWYYAVNAVGQFCTPDDTGVDPNAAAAYNMRTASDTDTQLPDNGTGFYADGETVTPLAEEFLRIIGATDTTPGYPEEDPSEPEQSYNMHTYVYEGEEFLGNASYLVPEKEYTVVVHAEQNEYDDTSVSFSVKMQNGTNLTAGEDYELSATTAAIGTEPDESGYCYTETVKLTILNEELVGETIVVEAVADQTGNVATNEVAVHYEEKDVTITLYDAEGNPVAGTNHGGTLDPDATYDIVATIPNAIGEDVVIYSTLDSHPVLDSIELVGLDAYAHAGNYTNSNRVDEETGKLVVGNAETFDCDEWMDDGITNEDALTLAIGADIVRIYESADAKNDSEEPTEIYYAYGQWDLYPTGQELYQVSVDDVLYISQGDHSDIFLVLDGNDANISADVTYQLEGNEDPTTKIEITPETEDHLDEAILTIGENETATELIITASIAGKGSGSKTVSLVYLNTLYIGDEPADLWGTYIDSSSTTSKAFDLSLENYWGNAVNGVTYELSGASVEDTKVEGNTLTLAAGENAYPMTLSATVDDVTTDYEVYVTAVEDSSYNYTIGVTTDRDYLNAANAPLLSSKGAAGNLTLTLYADGAAVEEVTWNTGSSNLTISGNTVSQAETVSMSEDMESCVVEALDSIGTKCAEVTVYLVREEMYNPIGTVASAETGATYCAFDYVPYEGEGRLGLVPTQICVYRIGDDVSEIYYCMETQNFNIADMADTFDTAYSGSSMPLVSSIENWPVTTE